jgi:hypothetical protein
MKIKIAQSLTLLFCCASSTAFAGRFTLAAGTATVGRGGSNPVSFTGPGEYSLIYTNSAKDRDFIFSLIPGIGYGVHFEPTKGTYFGVGGLIGFSGADLFLGPYMRAGYDFWCPWKFCFSLEFATSFSAFPETKQIPSNSSFALGVSL